MKVDKIANPQLLATQLHSNEPKATEQSKTLKTTSMNITIDTNIAAKAEQALSEMQNVDLAKVEAVKLALKNGDINLDIKNLSDAVMRFHTGHE